uniref:Uncharacterized protein n=1 Tax=Oryza barthii TaxID=65489 RepID=A0A0D3HWX0_9ORYZ
MAGCVKYQNIFFPSPSRGFKLLPKIQSPIPPSAPPPFVSPSFQIPSPLLSSLLAATAYLPPPLEASRRFREAAAERLQGHRLRERKVWFGEAQEGMRS